MKKVPYRDKISKIFGFSFVVFLLLSTALFAQDESTDQEISDAAEAAAESGMVSQLLVSGDAVKGKQLFNQNCAACHALDRKMTGPALANVETRLSEDEGLDKE